MIGLSGDVFWNLSLRELWSELLAARRRSDRERREAMTQAWMMAALTRVKEFPPLANFLGQPARPQTLAERRAALQVIRAQLTAGRRHHG